MPSISILFIVDTIWQRSIIISLDYKIGLCILDAPIRQQKMEKFNQNFYRRIQDRGPIALENWNYVPENDWHLSCVSESALAD